MGWFGEDDLSNFQLVEYFVSANIWRILTATGMFLALYFYTSTDSPPPKPVCHKMADHKAAARQVVAPGPMDSTPTSEEDQPQQQHGFNIVFNGPVHVVMPPNMGKGFNEWDYENQDCRSEMF